MSLLGFLEVDSTQNDRFIHENIKKLSAKNYLLFEIPPLQSCRYSFGKNDRGENWKSPKRTQNSEYLKNYTVNHNEKLSFGHLSGFLIEH